MARRATNRPTDGELEILKVLWERGPSTVREVREALLPQRQVAHTTVLTLLQIMVEKGLVEADTSARAARLPRPPGPPRNGPEAGPRSARPGVRGLGPGIGAICPPRPAGDAGRAGRDSSDH